MEKNFLIKKKSTHHEKRISAKDHGCVNRQQKVYHQQTCRPDDYNTDNTDCSTGILYPPVTKSNPDFID
jgi:hypothetical protein